MFPNTQFEITQPVLALISELDEFRGAWRALGTLAPERLTGLRRVATIESVGSSTRIEGSQLTDAEVAALLGNLKPEFFSTRDEQEVAGYAETMAMVFECWQKMPLTENLVLQLHRDLLRYSDRDAAHRGNYKTLPNSVAAFDEDGRQLGVIFAAAAPFDTTRLMAEAVEWTREMLDTRQMHPLLAIAMFLVVLLEVHPFQDGNGRLSRILTTLLLMRAGYAYVQYSSLESIVEQNKNGYYGALRQTQGTLRAGTPDWHPWIIFFLHALQQQKQRLEKKLQREHLLLSAVPELSGRILEYLREHGRGTIGEMAKLTGVSRNTIKLHLRQLVGQRQLALHGAGRGAWYSL